MTSKEVAQWMLDQMGASHWLHQEAIAQRIQISFGEEFVYRNKNGKFGIRKAVLPPSGLRREQQPWLASVWRRLVS